MFKPKRKFLIKIIIFELATGEIIREHVTDFNDDKCKEFMQNACVWAWSNHKSVEIFNVTDSELAAKLD